MKLTAKQTYRVVSFILRNPVFPQKEVFNATKTSWGRMNEIVQWLVSKKFIEKKKGNYELIDPAGLVSLFPLYRDMNSLVLKKMPLRISRKEILGRMPKNAVLCLDSALEFYSGYWRSDRVCIYAKEGGEILRSVDREFRPFSGGNNFLWVFRQDIEPETAKSKGFAITDKLRTLIDLVCDNKSHYAKDLYRQLWGLEFEE